MALPLQQEPAMFMETPQTLLFVTLGAFVLGWLVGKIGAYFGNRYTAKQRDPRDDRIRSLEAELRIAQSETQKVRAELEVKSEALKTAELKIVLLEKSVAENTDVIEKLRRDLKESVIKTRELRAELSDRATENLRSEVKLREVETELSVAQASTDLMATGVLDYSLPQDADDEDEDRPRIVKSHI